MSEAFVEVKGQDRYFDRAVRLYSSSCVSLLKNWGERLLISIPAGLRCANVEICLSANGAGWCQVMLDTRGGVRLSEQIQMIYCCGRREECVCKCIRRWFD